MPRVTLTKEQIDFIESSGSHSWVGLDRKNTYVICNKYTSTEIDGVYEVEHAKLLVPDGPKSGCEVQVNSHYKGAIFKFKD